MCEWDTAKFLIFSENSIPLIYYSHITSILIFIFLFGLTFLKLKEFPKQPFRIMAISYGIWLFCDLVLWANEIIPNVLFFWTVINLVEPIIFLSAFVFFLSFVEKRKLFTWERWALLGLLLPTLIMAPIGLSVVGFDYTTCDRNVVEGIAAYYNYFLEALFIVLIVGKAVFSIFKRKNSGQKVKIVLIAVGITLLLSSFLLANFFGTFLDNYDISQYGHIAVPIFAIFLAYVTIKFESIEPRILLVDTLVTAMIILIISLFFAESQNYRNYITALTLLLSIPMAYILVTNIRREIKARRSIQALASELEQSNSNLEHANDKLKSVDKLKTEFLSLASHQLRSPLTAIKGYSSMLIEGSYGKLNAKIDEPIKRIYISAQGLVSIVEDLLNVSKIEQGGMKYEFMQTDLAPIVQNLYNEMQIPAQSKNIVFTLDMAAGETFVVNVDPTKIKQVFLNLTDNSIKYTHDNGTVEVSLKRVDDTVVFAVKDNGVGISPETKAKLFEKFSRGEGGKLNTGGSGLGLYLAKQIAIAHKGDVVIESEGLGKGSVFKVVLPTM